LSEYAFDRVSCRRLRPRNCRSTVSITELAMNDGALTARSRAAHPRTRHSPLFMMAGLMREWVMFIYLDFSDHRIVIHIYTIISYINPLSVEVK
jgi:hypothetical protein